MSDPTRVATRGGDGSDLERELLESLRDVSPRGDEKSRAWSGIAAQLAAASAVGAGAAATASSAAAAESLAAAGGTKASVAVAAKSSLLAKWAFVAAALGGTAGAGIWVHQLTQSAAPKVDPGPSVSVRVRPATAAVVTPEPSPVPSVEASASVPRVSSASARPGEKREGKLSELLAAESALLTQARAKVRSGDLSGAETTLERLRSEFPAGVLRQEREVLAIEVLGKRGHVAAARQRAAQFIKAHPKSPHNELLRRYLEP